MLKFNMFLHFRSIFRYNHFHDDRYESSSSSITVTSAYQQRSGTQYAKLRWGKKLHKTHFHSVY